MAKAKTKKITEKELESIKDLQNRINTVIMNLGNAVVVQNQLTTSHLELQGEWKIETAKLEKKYGNVNISLEDGTLKIEGTSAVLDNDKEEVEYLHKGIAERNFIRTFKLAEFVEVKDAKLEDGILRVTLFRNVPDALKPQKINIS